ncbi:MAG: outer membrane beta-barrel protein [Desulfuromonadales bacterium]|nr:outer membrane beta-barrel protein [Desulfuromonadales bacterium]
MRKRYVLTILVAALLCNALVSATAAVAEDELGHISLGFGSLTPSRTENPRVQQFGLLTATYRLGSTENFRPYLGTGLAYTVQPDVNPGTALRVRTGVAAQAGFNYLLGEKSSLNLDYKYLELSPDSVRGSGSSPPHSVGVGLEIKF